MGGVLDPLCDLLHHVPASSILHGVPDLWLGGGGAGDGQGSVFVFLVQLGALRDGKQDKADGAGQGEDGQLPHKNAGVQLPVPVAPSTDPIQRVQGHCPDCAWPQPICLPPPRGSGSEHNAHNLPQRGKAS